MCVKRWNAYSFDKPYKVLTRTRRQETLPHLFTKQRITLSCSDTGGSNVDIPKIKKDGQSKPTVRNDAYAIFEYCPDTQPT